MNMFNRSCLMMLILMVPYTAKAETGQIIIDGQLNPLELILKCNTGRVFEDSLCLALKKRIQPLIGVSELSVNTGDLLFKYTESEVVPIDTGNNCEYTANITHLQASAKFLESARINIELNDLSYPIMYMHSLPVEILVDATVEVTTGVKLLGYCVKNPVVDEFFAHGALSTTSHLGLYFEVNPKLSRALNGDYVASIQPRIEVLSALEDTNVKYDLSGVNIFTGAYIALMGSTTTLFNGINNFSDAGTVNMIFQDALIDIGVGMALTSEAMGGPVDFYVDKTIEALAAQEVSKSNDNFTQSLENQLQNGLQQGLSLDQYGRLIFAVADDLPIRFSKVLSPPVSPQLNAVLDCQLVDNSSFSQLDWTSVEGTQLYQAQYVNVVKIDNVYQGMQLSVSTAYSEGDYYRVRACSAYGCSLYSEKVEPVGSGCL